MHLRCECPERRPVPELHIDGDSRPIGPLPDLGADEAWRVFLPLVLRES